MDEIAEGLRKLERDFAELKDNNAFIDTAMQASQVALRTSQQEKREALRNAVLNSALPDPPDECRQLMFIQYIDGFASIHMRILSLLDDPKAWFVKQKLEMPKGPPKTLWPVVSGAFPDVASEEVLCERVCRELHEKGLLIASSLRKDITRFPFHRNLPRDKQPGYRFVDELPSDGIVTHSGSPTVFRNWTTQLGRQFLAFIASPIGETSSA